MRGGRSFLLVISACVVVQGLKRQFYGCTFAHVPCLRFNTLTFSATQAYKRGQKTKAIKLIYSIFLVHLFYKQEHKHQGIHI